MFIYYACTYMCESLYRRCVKSRREKIRDILLLLDSVNLPETDIRTYYHVSMLVSVECVLLVSRV